MRVRVHHFQPLDCPIFQFSSFLYYYTHYYKNTFQMVILLQIYTSEFQLCLFNKNTIDVVSI